MANITPVEWWRFTRRAPNQFAGTWQDMATVEMGASWDHEYKVKSSILSSISRGGTIIWQISGYERNQLSRLQHLAKKKPFTKRNRATPLIPWKLWLPVTVIGPILSSISHQAAQISQTCCTDGLHLEFSQGAKLRCKKSHLVTNLVTSRYLGKKLVNFCLRFIVGFKLTITLKTLQHIQTYLCCDLSVQKRRFNNPALKLYIVSPVMMRAWNDRLVASSN